MFFDEPFKSTMNLVEYSKIDILVPNLVHTQFITEFGVFIFSYLAKVWCDSTLHSRRNFEISLKFIDLFTVASGKIVQMRSFNISFKFKYLKSIDF